MAWPEAYALDNVNDFSSPNSSRSASMTHSQGGPSTSITSLAGSYPHRANPLDIVTDGRSNHPSPPSFSHAFSWSEPSASYYAEAEAFAPHFAPPSTTTSSSSGSLNASCQQCAHIAITTLQGLYSAQRPGQQLTVTPNHTLHNTQVAINHLVLMLSCRRPHDFEFPHFWALTCSKVLSSLDDFMITVSLAECMS